MAQNSAFSLAQTPVHLGLGATVVRQEPFTGTPDWYAAYGARHSSDGYDGRLVSLHSFNQPWTTWEMHPHGEELVGCVSGSIVLYQELDGAVRSVVLKPGEAIVNPRGVWHTADIAGSASAFFITAGVGTELRPR